MYSLVTVTESPLPTTLVECSHQLVLTTMMSPGCKVALIAWLLLGHSHQHSGGALSDLGWGIVP